MSCRVRLASDQVIAMAAPSPAAEIRNQVVIPL
jgi:hypothetical protein